MKDLKLDTVAIQPGFFMLDSYEWKSLRNRVTLTRGFDMLATPVTQGLYLKVMGDNPSAYKGPFEQPAANQVLAIENIMRKTVIAEQPAKYGLLQHPVENVAWLDTVRFCNKLSELMGLNPAYVIDGENVEWPDMDADGWRLPTFCEFEYACKAGTDTDYFFGNLLHTPESIPHIGERMVARDSRVEEYAWHYHNAHSGQVDENGVWIPHTKPVGLKKPNPWGLYDIIGNVCEWVWDLHVRSRFCQRTAAGHQGHNTEYEKIPEITDPHKPSFPHWGNKKSRSVRGSHFGQMAPDQQSHVHRDGSMSAQPFIGFRIVRTNSLRLKYPEGPYHLNLEDAPVPGWRETRIPRETPSFHQAIEMQDKKVLFITHKITEIFDPHVELWRRTGDLHESHGQGKSCVVLQDGRVMLISQTRGDAPSQCELYNPKLGTWKKIGAPKVPRFHAQLTLLKDGRVLVSGGAVFVEGPQSIEVQSHCEIWDPKTFMWVDAAPMNSARYEHQAVLLNDGSVLAIGGHTKSIERWHLDGDWEKVDGLAYKIHIHQALLVGEHVLVVGGAKNKPWEAYSPTGTQCESWLIDTTTFTRTSGGKMSTPRENLGLVKLNDGRVLALGGINESTPLKCSEIWDPTTRTWSEGPTTNSSMCYHTTTLLNDGRVLAIGGKTTEIWDPTIPVEDTEESS
jgi:formylglycine-generating enzyme required for sulfatase activity